MAQLRRIAVRVALAFAALSIVAPAELCAQTGDAAVVVLIGDAAQSEELREVLVELLARQHVTPSFEARPRFEPDAWLDRNLDDPRSFAFVTLPDPNHAELYLRGPRGQKFLRRVLELRDGLDEVGRELIAGVIETSIATLLRSDEGLSREQARAELTAVAAPATPSEPALASEATVTPVPERSPWSGLLGVRVLAAWTGSDLGGLLGLGLEAGVAWRALNGWRLRARLSAEAALPQTLEAGGVEASVITAPLRVNVEVGTAFDLYLGAGVGFDLAHLSPSDAAQPGLTPTAASTELAPAARAELRYDLKLGPRWLLGCSLLADFMFERTHYDVVASGRRVTVAAPWQVRPGLALSLGFVP